MQYPTPILKDRRLPGAVNILIDIIDATQAQDPLGSGPQGSPARANRPRFRNR